MMPARLRHSWNTISNHGAFLKSPLSRHGTFRCRQKPPRRQGPAGLKKDADYARFQPIAKIQPRVKGEGSSSPKPFGKLDVSLPNLASEAWTQLPAGRFRLNQEARSYIAQREA